jgi:lipopolysaccharide transport system ATP-binding protein
MSDVAIRVEGLGKRYRIGANQQAYRTLREKLNETALAPFRAVRHLLTRNGNGQAASGKTSPFPLTPSPLPSRASRETFWALKDVSFEVKRGEVVGIIGRNGAGKSTLLKILSRITEPTEGYADINGRIASLLEVGTGFHPELTGRENIYLNGSILGMKRVEINKKFDEIVAFAEIEKFIDTPVKHYSSGMYVRLAFAVAAHLDPEILLVDEVLAVGDAGFQKKCLGKMGDVAREGRTVLFVSHNMAAVRKLCERAMLFESGRMANQGKTSNILGEYLDGSKQIESEYKIPAPSEENAPGWAHTITVEDGEGNPTVTVPVGKPWQVRVRFVLKRQVEHFVIGLGMRTNEEVALRTSWSTPCTLKGGEYEVLFRENTLVLGSGRYHLIIGLSTNERTFHYVEDAAVLEIANYSDGLDLMRVSDVGIILNPLTVEITRSPE